MSHNNTKRMHNSLEISKNNKDYYKKSDSKKRKEDIFCQNFKKNNLRLVKHEKITTKRFWTENKKENKNQSIIKID